MPSCWPESRQTPAGKKYRVVWRDVVLDGTGRAFSGKRRTGPFVYNARLVKELLRQKRDELEAQALGLKPRQKQKTWREIADAYLDHCRKHKATGTYNNFDRPAVLAFTDSIGNPLASNITSEDIAKWENELMENGYGPSTVSMRLRAIRTAFNYAKKMSWLSALPVFHLPPEVEVGRALSHAELQDLVKAVAKPVQRAIKILVHTGMRLGELCALEWQDIRKNEEGTWEANIKTLKRKRGENQRYRVIALHGIVVAALGATGASGPVLGALTRNALSSAYGKAVKQLGLPRTRIHDLRHTWATRFMEKTGDLYGLMRLGGWKDLQSVERYQHLTRGRSNAILGLDFGL